MKSLIALTLFLSVSSTTFASWPTSANIEINPTSAIATVSNTTGHPVVCSGAVYGQLSSGHWMKTYISNIVIYPGENAYAIVSANNPNFDPMITAFANIYCN